MSDNDILSSVQDGVLTITLNRPETLNAIHTAMVKKMCSLVEAANTDDSIKVIIITGAGKGFCSGADVKLRLGGAEKVEKIRNEVIAPYGTDFLTIAKCQKPTIAALNGVAAGAGLAIAFSCDFRIASERAKITLAWIKRGMSAEDGVTYYLPRMVGVSKALEMMLTGNPVGAEEAERIGLVNKVVPEDKLMDEANALARTIANGPSIAIELTKMLAYKGLHNDLESQLAIESFCQPIIRQTEDFKEGLDSFREKRPPQFKGK